MKSEYNVTFRVCVCVCIWGICVACVYIDILTLVANYILMLNYYY